MFLRCARNCDADPSHGRAPAGARPHRHGDAFIQLHNVPDAGELSREDWLGLLVDREATSRENKRLARRLREARLCGHQGLPAA